MAEKRIKKTDRKELRVTIPADCELASKYASIQVKRDGVVISINSEIESVK